MKILWIVNIIFPYPSEQLGLSKNVFGGWLLGLSDILKKHEDIELAICSVYKGDAIKEFDDGNIKYYLIPGAPALKYTSEFDKYANDVINRFNPDLIHLHGTEFAHGLGFLNSDKKIVVSIQGILSVYSNYYLSELKASEIFKNITIRDVIKNDNLWFARRKFINRACNEKVIIKKAVNFIGRTDWDYANCKALNAECNYYKNNETLRSEFYNDTWDYDKCNKKTIFCSQAGYPIKGLHKMIKGLALIKREHSDVVLKIAGLNIYDNSTFKKRLKLSGYGKYINKLIKKYDLQNNIIFTGPLSAEAMKNELLTSNVFVQSSIIENSPNSLGEAMLLGVPCVASNVGGTSSMLKDKEEGLLYPFSEEAMLAQYVIQIFNDVDLCNYLSKNSKERASITHNGQINSNELIDIYKTIIKD